MQNGWGRGGGGYDGGGRSGGPSRGGHDDFSVFVGDLANDVSDVVLQEYFRRFYPSVRSAKVISDTATGRSKGFGFVRFGEEKERDRALTEMHGQVINGRPIRVRLATAKRTSDSGPVQSVPASSAHPSDYDAQNTTLFIGGLSASVSEDQLRSIFGLYGDIIYVKIPPGKGCGFVQFIERRAAERAMADMNGQVIGNSSVRISWGRSTNKAQTPPVPAAATAYPGYGVYPGYDPATMAAYGTDPYAQYYSPEAYAAWANMYGVAAAPHPAHAMAYGQQGAAIAVDAAAAATPQSQPQDTAPKAYDPLHPDVEAMNDDYIDTQLPALLGTHLHAVA